MYRFFVSLLTPLPILCLVMAVALVLLWRRRRATRGQLLWLTVPFCLLVLVSMPAVAHLALGSLEWAYPPENERPEETQAIVVLSGYVRPPDTVRPEPELAEDTLSRCLHAAKLYHQGKPCLVVVSGGQLDPSTPGPTLAAVMRDFLLTQGVAAGDILTEDRSTTTYENARETAALLSDRGIDRIVLVTSAAHMMRSKGCFRAQGLQVVPSSCDHRATQFRWRFANFLPSPHAAEHVDLAMHEWLGMAWYWLWGRI